MKKNQKWFIFALLSFSLLLASGVQAAVVGRFIVVEGQVDLLKKGKVPALPARVNDGVEPGDVIRTKSTGRARVKFMDDSLVTLAPESRLAVADFVYEADLGQRRAVLRYFKGVIHTLVPRLLKMPEPDFLMETHTAVMGVRGTENYTVLLPNATGAYLIDGLLELRSCNPEITDTVLLKNMEFSTILLGQAPTLPRPIHPGMLQMLQNLMDTGLKETAFLGVGAPPPGPGVAQIPEVLGFVGQEKLPQPTIPPRLILPRKSTPSR